MNCCKAISLETAGFIGNKYKIFYSFAYIFIVVFFIIIMISLNVVKNKKLIDARISKNNIRHIDSKIKIENKITSKKCF